MPILLSKSHLSSTYVSEEQACLIALTLIHYSLMGDECWSTGIAEASPALRNSPLHSCPSLSPLHVVISYHSLEDRIVKRLMAGESDPEVLLSRKERGGYRLERRRALRGHGNQQDVTAQFAESSQLHHMVMEHWTLQVLHKKVSC